MTAVAIILSIAVLIGLIAGLKVQPFLAFLVAALLAGVLLGIPLAKVPLSIERGIADMLGSVVAILCLGAMFGKLIADSGAARRIANTLVATAGPRRITLAMAATGFVVGIPLFYNVGFVLLVPLIFSIVARVDRPAVYLGIPMLAGLSIAHGFLPPHPSPTALVGQFGADMGTTLLYGLIVGIPTLAIAGPIFASTLKGIVADPPGLFHAAAPIDDADLPSAGTSFACAILPVVLIAGATVLGYLPGLDEGTRSIIAFVGNPTVVMLISVGLASVVLGVARGRSLGAVMEAHGSAVRDIAVILLIIAGAGALKQVFVDGGANAALAGWMRGLGVPPLLLGWLLAVAIRIALGSATVAGLTAAGIAQPLVASGQVDPNLMVLAIGAGSLMFSHVNDSGFWMFKEYFGLTLRDTFRSWSMMETLVGAFGLVFVLLLNAVIA